MPAVLIPYTKNDGTVSNTVSPWGPVMQDLIDELERDNYNVKCYGHEGSTVRLYFENDRDAVMFRLKYE